MRGAAALVPRLYPPDARRDVGRGRTRRRLPAGAASPACGSRRPGRSSKPREVVAQVYSAAGATAIFNENPFERRLRDIHAGTQQGQGRPVHFETVGQILLGLPPEGRMFR